MGKIDLVTKDFKTQHLHIEQRGGKFAICRSNKCLVNQISRRELLQILRNKFKLNGREISQLMRNKRKLQYDQ